MRALSSLILGIVAIVLVVGLAILAVQNTGAVPLQFLGFGTSGHVWWIVLGAAIVGFLVAALFLLPGRVAAGWRSQGLSRQMERMDQELATVRQEHARVDAEHNQLQQQYQQLQVRHDQLADERGSLVAERDKLAAEHDRLMGERDQMRQQPPMTRSDQPAAAAPDMAPPPATDTPYPAYPAPPVRSDVPREDVAVGPPPNRERIEGTTEHADTGDGEQPSLGDRVRDFFRPSQQAAPDQDQPPADTTVPDGTVPPEDRPVNR
jgi:uncharacterized integral membrane protein